MQWWPSFAPWRMCTPSQTLVPGLRVAPSWTSAVGWTRAGFGACPVVIAMAGRGLGGRFDAQPVVAAGGAVGGLDHLDGGQAVLGADDRRLLPLDAAHEVLQLPGERLELVVAGAERHPAGRPVLAVLRAAPADLERPLGAAHLHVVRRLL